MPLMPLISTSRNCNDGSLVHSVNDSGGYDDNIVRYRCVAGDSLVRDTSRCRNRDARADYWGSSALRRSLVTRLALAVSGPLEVAHVAVTVAACGSSGETVLGLGSAKVRASGVAASAG